ncbi:hypothetical protein [Brevundimonas diminuta]|uniref:hypothetical protein n=1 Tax=Brevundimonas diminuta TaxID=293 RepID=UPI003F7DEAAB
MTCLDGNFMGLDSHEPRGRLARYLRRQYAGAHATKRLASDIECTPKTAENILSGCWPNSRHWAAIARRFGADVLEAVFAPEIDATVAKLEAEVRDLERELEQKRAMARQASRRGAGREADVAPTVDRAA